MEKPSLPADIIEELPVAVRVYIGYLEQRLADLETKINQNSHNSSKPPSSDPPSAPPRPAKKKSGKKPGGQVGHTRHIRQLVPVEEVNEVKEWWPTNCANPECGKGLRPRDQVGEAKRQQVWEIVLNPVVVTEHQFFACECPECGRISRGQASGEVGKGMFGPQMVAAVASLHGRFRLTEREIVAVLESLWGIKVSLGSVAQMCEKASLALAEIYEEVQKQIPKEPKLNLDETSWKLGGKKKHWLWVAVSRLVVLFKLDEKRDSAAFRKIVGEEYEGIVSSDRFRSYSGLEAEKHQWCWAHLIRDFRRMSERAGPGGIWGEEALELSRQVFEEWQEYRQSEGKMSLQELKEALGPIRTDFKQLLKEGEAHEDGAVKSLCGELNKAEASLWVFSEVAGVEPTNNAAEVRPVLPKRMVTFGDGRLEKVILPSLRTT